MQKVKILKNFSIAFDGINISRLKKDEEIEVNDYELSRLIHYGVVEIKEKPKKKGKTKNLDIEIKEKPKK
jgi:hypothetical protein